MMNIIFVNLQVAFQRSRAAAPPRMKMASRFGQLDFSGVLGRFNLSGVPRYPWGCEKIRNLWETRRVGTPPPMIRKELRALLEARCPHRANFFTAPLRGRGFSEEEPFNRESKIGRLSVRLLRDGERR